jgi:hypothetical protein
VRFGSIVAAAAAAACLLAARPAHATLTNTCHLTGDPNVMWFAPKTTVDVWVTTAVGFNPMVATGLSQTQFTNAVSKSLNIWNEEGGTSLKLRFRGLTTALSVNKAVVITGRTDVCNNALAVAFPGLVKNKYANGTIEFRRFAGTNCSVPVNWVTTPTGGTDVVAVLNHELGHQVYNMDHPLGQNTDCQFFGQMSVMRTPSRVLKNWDLEVAQGRYGPRAKWSRFWKSKMMTATTWSTAFEATGMSFLRPLYRPGSMSQRATTPFFGWVYAFDDGVQNGGTGRADINRYQHGSQDWHLLTAPDGTFGRPIAVAYKPQTFTASELLIAYQKVFAGNTIYNSDAGQICYRRSLTNGATWSGETCPSGAFANTYGLSAAWDWYTNSYIITFTQHAPLATPARNFEIAVLTVPVTGSSTPSTITFTGVSSPHGAGIACGGVINGSNCLIVHETADAFGVLGWFKVNFNPSTGVGTRGPTSTQGLFVYDTPSVIYVPNGDTFRLAYTVANSAIYSYTMANFGTSWAGTGDIFNNSSAHVSTVVLNARQAGSNVAPYGWFIKYW